ncbi:MAG: hypothetical protein KOO62_04800 [candidate division Zixibacteria bacterium]|nr:hypothetical protein [candidate division Zixibacteria bacterium]
MNLSKNCRPYIFGSIIALFVCSNLLLSCGQGDDECSPGILNTEPTVQLLDVIQILIDHNPDYEQYVAMKDSVSRDQWERTLDSLIQINMANPEIVAGIEMLVSTEAYQLYYRQFRNMDSEKHRRMLCALPYSSIQSPADISRNLFDLSSNLDSVRHWVESIVSRIDLQQSHSIALKWLPEGEYNIPSVHLIFDGNGDAFAREGQVVFDLFGVLLSQRPYDTRFSNLTAIGTQEIEEVLAHEFHHVYARPFLGQPISAVFDDWRDQWRSRLIRRMVSEGIAMHCNPPREVSRAIKEDTAIVAYWIRSLNEKLGKLRTNTVTEEQLQNWLSDTYHNEAQQLLREYLHREYRDYGLRRMLTKLGADRPSLVYTLGWWMVSRIGEHGTKPEELTALLADPYALFARYNEVMGDAPDSLLVRD